MTKPGASSSSPDNREFKGILIKKEAFTAILTGDKVILSPESGVGTRREFHRSSLFDAVPEVNPDGLPSIALAINAGGIVRRMVVAFPEWAGGRSSRDCFGEMVHLMMQGGCTPPLVAGSKVRIKGSEYRLEILEDGITITPASGRGAPRAYQRSAIVGCRRDEGELPSLLLRIHAGGAVREMILSFPEGAVVRDQADTMIRQLLPVAKAQKREKELVYIDSIPGVVIKGQTFTIGIADAGIRITPESGEGAEREFLRSDLFDIVSEFTPDGEYSAVLAIMTGTGVRRMNITFPAGMVDRDRAVRYVKEIIDGVIQTGPIDHTRREKRASEKEYPICQRSGLMTPEGRRGILLTSQRLIIYEGDDQNVAIIREHPRRSILDASPCIDSSGEPSILISFIGTEKEIGQHHLTFGDGEERDAWIALLTSDETPPPLIEEEELEITPLEENGGESRQEEETDEEPEYSPPDNESGKPPSPERCPVCNTILTPESPWCDICGIRLSPEGDWRESDDESPCIGISPPREFGRLLTFLIAPSGAGRFGDDPFYKPFVAFISAVLLCIFSNLLAITAIYRYVDVDPSLYPLLTELTTEPWAAVFFTLSILLIAALLVLVTSIIAYLITGRADGGFGRIFRITLYAILPFGIAGLIPVIGILLAACWSIIIISIALRSTFDFSGPASLFPPALSYTVLLTMILLLPRGLF